MEHQQDNSAPPFNWSADLREQWMQLGPRYQRLGNEILQKLTLEVDTQPVFLTYIRMTEACDKHAQLLAQEGEILRDRFGQSKRNPRADLYRDCMDRQLKAYRHLGLDQEQRGSSQGDLFQVK
jgi:hypothetical protein